MPPRECPSGSEGLPVGRIDRISFRFLLAEKWKKNILIIYAPESARAVARALPVKLFRYGRRESACRE